MGPFLEGVESVLLPCTLALIVPGITVVLAARRRALVAGGSYLVATVLMSWARFAEWVTFTPETVGLIFVGALTIAAAAVILGVGKAVPTAAAAAMTGANAALLWRPCVGEHLGQVISESYTNPVGSLGGVVAFVVGASLPLVVLLALPIAIPRLVDDLDRVGVATAAALGLSMLGVLMAVGRYDDLVAELLVRSSF